MHVIDSPSALNLAELTIKEASDFYLPGTHTYQWERIKSMKPLDFYQIPFPVFGITELEVPQMYQMML